ncbi:PLDc_N domain-containing protein [Micromonospora sp. MMS20-R2-23]|uniref:PLDc_N domain-containing protein n=1 Tax=Micromonospora antibiotica TaxID=2807623 RepID=A0ABS3V7W4_9ACTN|nr:PLDc_N domain-containing protein [Micromonospora antibiotica]
MARLYVVLFLLQVVLAAGALISCLSAEDEGIRGLPRFAWVLVILVFPLVGSIAWFLAGRPAPTGDRRGGWPSGTGSRRPVAPDDDPEFLKSIDERASRDDNALFQRWEEDLRRREDDLRRHDGKRPRDGAPPREDTPPADHPPTRQDAAPHDGERPREGDRPEI